MRSNKIILFVLLLFCFTLINPALSEPVKLLDKTTVQEEVTVQNEETLNTDVVKTTPKTQEIIENSASWPYENNLKDTITPEPKSEIVRVIFSFLKVMLGVVISSVIIFVLAILAKKFYGIETIPNESKNITPQENLKPSKNEDEALKKFLNKTL